MRALVYLVALVALVAAHDIPARNYDERQYFIVELDTLQSLVPLDNFIRHYNDTIRFEHPARGLDDHFVFSVDKTHAYALFLGNHNSNSYNLMKRLDGMEDDFETLTTFPHLRLIHMLEPKKLEHRMPVSIDRDDLEHAGTRRRFDIVDSSQEPLKEVSEKLGINDPLFPEQWHLVNTQYPGNDVNVKNVWYDGITGKGVTVAIIDDGLDYESEDLKDNFSKEGLYDFNDNTPLPKPRLFDDYHGTRCAGEVAAVKNDMCGVGVAYDSKVAGIRILSKSITSEEEAAAMIYAMDHNDIYSCSWGPTDNGRTVAAPDRLVRGAILKGVQEGRDSKGALYVFASGNGGRVGDQCNFDGYTNSIYSITVGAIDFKGLHPTYAEACTAVMVVTYSSGSGENIHTTDIHGKCSAKHGGTSAAAPLAAGIYALVLQANPDLSWRDVQYVSAYAAVPVNEDQGGYQKTALGQMYSSKYGYGKIDAELLVKQAKEWKNVKPQSWYFSDKVIVDQRIVAPADKDSEVISSSIQVSKDDLGVMNLERLEHVTVTVNIESKVRGRLDVRITSPFGMVSILAEKRELDMATGGLNDWTFMSVAHWGEEGVGEWKLEVHSAPNNEVHIKDWQLKFFGEARDADTAEKFNLDTDYAQVRRDRLSSLTTAATTATSTTMEAATSKAASEDATNSTQETSSQIPTTTTETTTHATSAIASATPSDTEEETEPEGANKHYSTDHVGQYFMLLAVLGFIFVVLMLKWQRRQSGTRRRRGDFEFDIIPGEDYSDSEDDEESYELDMRNPDDVARERLFDEFNAESLPDYEDDMFQIGDEDDVAKVGESPTQADSNATQRGEDGEGSKPSR